MLHVMSAALFFLLSIAIVTSVQFTKPEPISLQQNQGFLNFSENDVLSVDSENARSRTVKYLPTWESLDSRPLPTWYDEAKVGIFINWGVHSVPSYVNEWFWWGWQGDNVSARNPGIIDFMKRNYPPNFTYQDFAPQFTAELFNASEWAELFKKSGARYVVFSSKHHEGFTNWPSKYSFGWNSMDVGPKRDLVGELAKSIRKNTNLRFGIYHSLTEWFHPLLLADKDNNFTTNTFVQFKTMPELYELVENYQPDVIWSDGHWGGDSGYWESRKFLAWLYNESPVKTTVVTNDRWGTETPCQHGGFYSCADRFNPGTLQAHKWENCMTLDKQSWGFRRDAKFEDFLTPKDLIRTVVETVACGGNILINVGPTKEGVITPIQQVRLLQLGEWLCVNGEAIYGTIPWKFQNDTATPGVWYTSNSPSNDKIYVFVLSWPLSSKVNGGEVYLESVDPGILGVKIQSVRMLDIHQDLAWKSAVPNKGIRVSVPPELKSGSKWARVIVIQTRQNY